MQLNLKAKDENQKRILKYLCENATPLLAEKINSGKKTMQGCWKFITEKARKKAVGGCACIEDAEVFGWAMHYFEEDAIEEKNAPAKETAEAEEAEEETVKARKTAREKPTKKASPKKGAKTAGAIFEEQTSLFDILG